MNTKDELRLVEYWLDNPNNIPDIPNDLKEKITEEDAIQAFVRIETPTNDNGLNILHMSNVFDYAEKLRQKLRDELEIKKLKNKNRVIFDSHIFDCILDGNLSIHKIKDSQTKGFEYYTTPIQVEELSNCPDADKRTKLSLIKTSIAPILIPTDSFVFGTSRLGHARLGNAEVFNQITETSENKEKFTNDALIGETAIKGGFTLVTNDVKIRNKVNAEGGKAISLEEFNSILKLLD